MPRPRKTVKEKFGVVIILDALGASTFSTDQIKTFLSTRSEVNSIVKSLAKNFPPELKRGEPVIFTFGDTLIITVEIHVEKEVPAQIFCTALLMRRYLFHSLQHRILFRGAFSIGKYVEDSRSNTVMGEAVADAAEWYERADWMGLYATPRTSTELEYHISEDQLDRPSMLFRYPVPMKDKTTPELYCISWPGAFFDKQLGKSFAEASPRQAFWGILRHLSFPASAASKYDNTKKFFSYVEARLVQKPTEPSAPSATIVAPAEIPPRSVKK